MLSILDISIVGFYAIGLFALAQWVSREEDWPSQRCQRLFSRWKIIALVGHWCVPDCG